MNMTTRARLRALRHVFLVLLFIPIAPIGGLIFGLMLLWDCITDVVYPWSA